MASIYVIVPVYNVENYISRCIDSILAQTFADFKVILVDDGSIDRSGEICDKYASNDDRIHVIHKKNGGLSSARNTGIDYAIKENECEWISFIDGEDWISTSYLELLYKAVHKNDTRIAIGEAIRTHGENNYDDELTSLAVSVHESVLWKTSDYYFQNTTNAEVAWGKLYHVDCLEHIRFPIGKTHGDEFTTYRILFRQKNVSVVNYPIYFYFQNDNFITRGKWTPGELDTLEAIEQQVAFFVQNGYENIAKIRFNFLLKNSEKNRKEILRSETLTVNDRRAYILSLNKQLRRVLFRYRHYKWLPFYKNDWNKQIYTNAFIGIRISRKVWGGVKSALKSNTVTRQLGLDIGDTIGWNEKQIVVRKYVRGIEDADVVLLQTPLHGNLGDQAIVQAEEELLKEMKVSFCEFPWTEEIEKQCANLTPPKKVILIQGGGFLGQLWPNEEKRIRATLQAFHKNKVVIFPQTFYIDLDTQEGRDCLEESKAAYESHPDLTIFLRESYSYDFIRKYMPKVHVELVPDIVMMLHWKPLNLDRRNVLLCMRHDKEKTITKESYNRLSAALDRFFEQQLITDTVIPGNIDISKRKELLDQKLREFSAVELVVTDRLHGMIFAAITETPCVVVNSLSHKIRGCYEWLKDLNYIRLVDNLEQLPDVINQLKTVQPKYDCSEISQAMKPLYEILQRAADNSQT